MFTCTELENQEKGETLLFSTVDKLWEKKC